MSLDLLSLSIASLQSEYQKAKLSPVDVTDRYLDVIEAQRENLGAFLEIDIEKVKQRAQALESCRSEIKSMPLFGVPVALKDNLLLKDWKATAGSKILQHYEAPYSATCVRKLEDAGAIVVGKTNCDEFAMGSSNENSAYFPAKNPWDQSRVPGGSSGGSAVAVAARLCAGALGTDTGGSIRQPASFCGVVGLKPTYGRVSRSGVIAFGSSLDQVGPLAGSVADVGRLLSVISGYDPLDATSSQRAVPNYSGSSSDGSIKGVKVGVVKQWQQATVPSALSHAFDQALKLMESAGAQLVEISLPHVDYAIAVYYIIAPSEASSNLARYDGVHYGYRTPNAQDGEGLYFKSRGEALGSEVKLRIMLGTYALSSGYYDAYYAKATRVRALIKEDMATAFKSCDVIAGLTAPSTAFKFGTHCEDPLQMYLSDMFTVPANLAGTPAISVPCGRDEEGLPIGLHLMGPWFEEESLLQVAHNYETLRGEFPSPPLGAGA